VTLGQKSVLTVPDTAAIPGGITPPSADYPDQARVRFIGTGTMYSLAEVEGRDAQIDVLKAVSLSTNYVVSGGQTLRVAAGGSLALNSMWIHADNRMILDGGSVTVNTRLWIPQSTSAYVNGYMDVLSGSLVVNGPISDNRASFFVITQTGGSVTAASLEGTTTDRSDGNTGGESGNSYYYLRGGSLTLSNLVTRAGWWANYRRINLHIGEGTYRASADHSINDKSSIILTASEGGTGTIDTQGYTLTLNTPLTGPGGFTKIGSGTLALGVENSFTGTMIVAEGTLNVNAPSSMTNVFVNGGTVNLNTNNAMTSITVNGGLLNMGAANASLSAMTIAGGTVVPKHADAFGAANIGLAGGTLDVRAAGAVVPAKALNVSAASTLRTKFDNPANLSVGTMTGVLSLDVDITGASTSVEYKLLSASSQPAAEGFALIGSYGDKKAELIFKADGVYLNLKAAATLIFLR
jgi:autotransporter-associated beta strand protein